MKEKIFKTIVTSVLILILISFDIVLLGYNVVLAVSANSASNLGTNISNVEFDVYFKQDETNLYEKQIDVAAEDTLYLRINVKNEGILNELKIQINDSNFSILKDKVQNSYVKEINAQTNEITLNSITYGNDIEIALPIQFKVQDIFNSNYFTQENSISISGKYQKDSETAEEDLSAGRNIKINWTSNCDVYLNQNVEKYMSLSNNKVLLQQNIVTEVQDNRLPREQEILSVNVPIIDEQKPENVYVILNGENISNENINLDLDNNNLEIKNINQIDSENRVTWENGKNEYKIIYIYPGSIGEQNRTIDIDVTSKTKLYTRDEIQKNDKQTIEISKMGNVVDLEKSVNKTEIYKGYLYANSDNVINFEEEENINISYAEVLNNLQISTLENYYANEANERKSAKDNINYTGISINKENMLKILGEEANIIIQDENDLVIGNINGSTEADENGNINISFDSAKKNIKITTSKPITEGVLSFRYMKNISGQNNYTKEELKSFNNLIVASQVETSLGTETKEYNIALKDTSTQAKLELNNTSFSTLQTNENVQFLITLINYNEQYDLYKNPVVEIVLPREININVKNTTQLNKNDELSIVDPKITENENGEKIISMPLQGEQKTFGNTINEGIQILITADISIDKTVPTKDAQITLNYTNENRTGENFAYQLPISLKSKDGVLVINKLENYNNNGDIIESIDDKVKEAKLDINATERTANGSFTVVNNYDNAIENIEIIGSISNITTLSNLQVNGRETKIYYSTDEDLNTQNWQETIENEAEIKSFKLVVLENKLEAKEVLNVTYNLNISEKLQGNQNEENQIIVKYSYMGNDLQNISKINLTTNPQEITEGEELAIQEPVENIKDMNVTLISRTGGQNLAQGDTVKEGQGIKNIVKIENTGTEEITNIKIVAKQSNAIFYDEVVHSDGWNSSTGETNVDYTMIEENPELSEKVLSVDSLKAGESITLNYQFSVKQIDTQTGQTEGTIQITADGIEEQTINTIANEIEKAELKLQMRNKYEEEYIMLTNRQYPFFMDVTNLTQEEQKDVNLTLNVPEGFSFSTEYLFEAENFEFVSYEDNVLKLRIPTIPATETVSIRLGLFVDSWDTDIRQRDMNFFFTGEMNGKTYISNEMSKTIYNAESKITAEQIGSIEEDTLKNGDELTYEINIKNDGPEEKELEVTDYVPFAAVIQNSKIEIYDEDGNLVEEKDIEVDQNNNLIRYSFNLANGNQAKLIINTIIDTDKAFDSEITNIVDIAAFMQTITCNDVTYKIESSGGENPGVVETHEISGVAWLDENENGYKEESEQKLSNIPVVLVDEETGEIVTNRNGEECIGFTDFNGEYLFTGLEQGSYLVIFQYNDLEYYPTEYRKEGISEDKNSDVISKNIILQGEEQKVAVTASIQISTSNISNIDAGFIRADRFDLKLDKYVNKIIIQDSRGTIVQQFNKEKLAKVEIDSSRINNTRLIIEYQIDVTNEGEASGYVNQVIDYKPNDLSFSSEMNQNWYQVLDGNLSSNELSNQIINPGETKTITLTLIKDLNSNNIGNIINQAEIMEVSNSLSIADIDSTPGNKADGEDDMSTAEVLVSIRTGGPVVYTLLIITIITILAVGIYLINRNVLNPERR